MSDKPFVLAVAGPTASGKTWLGVELAKRFDGEVVSADSMQIYKGMDIASAKPTKEEMQGIPHHLIDLLDRSTVFSAADYVKLAGECINDILSRGKLPIVVGGTGLYIDSLLGNVTFSEVRTDPDYRRELTELAEREGNEVLYDMLVKADPAAAESIHMNNVVRVVRALEVIHTSGRLFSELKAESRRIPPQWDSLMLGLNTSDRSVLYERIDRRVDDMVSRGLVEEAREIWLRDSSEGGFRTAANAIGIKELYPYFEGVAGLEECLDRIRQESRRYAKRQLTWFRRNEYIHWIIFDNFSQKNEILKNAINAMEIYKNV